MAQLHGWSTRQVRSVAEKAAYSRSARKRLMESRAKLDGVSAFIRHQIATGSLKNSEQLDCAQRAMAVRLAAAETQLEALRKSGEEDWEDLRDQLESAWEDLSHSISKLVARLKDESR